MLLRIAIVGAALLVGAGLAVDVVMPASSRPATACPFLSAAAGLPLNTFTTTQFTPTPLNKRPGLYACGISLGSYSLSAVHSTLRVKRTPAKLPNGAVGTVTSIHDPGFKAWALSYRVLTTRVKEVLVRDTNTKTGLFIAVQGRSSMLPALNQQEAIAIADAVLRGGERSR